MFIAMISVITFFVICILIIDISIQNEQKTEEYHKETNPEWYVKPQLKELSQEQIDDIHKRGKITAAEKVKEYESMDLCAPGDGIGSAAWRCRKFHGCHDCLVDYVKDKDEYELFENILKNIKPYKI